MLAHFSVLTAFFSFLGVFCALRRRFVDVLTVFFVFWRPPGSIFTVQGWFFRLQNAICQCFCAPARAQSRNVRHATKPQFFLGFLYGFYTSHASCSRFKPTRNRSESRSNSAFCKDCAKNASWGGFWEGWACFGAPLGRLLFALGWFLASLGCFLGVSWALLGRSWLSLGCSVKLQCWMLGPRLAPGLTFTGFGEVPD